MNKNILLIILFSIFINIANAQVSGDQEISSGDIEINTSAKPNIDSLNTLGKIGVNFCNDGIDIAKLKRELIIDTRPGKEENICVFLSNENTGSIKIEISLSEGKIGKNGESLCEGESDDFLKLYNTNPEKQIASLDPNKYIVQNIKLVVPENLSGEQRLCVGATLIDDNKDLAGGIFLMKYRKASKINLNISGDVYKKTFFDTSKETISNNKVFIIQIIIAIIALMLITTIIQNTKKKKK